MSPRWMLGSKLNPVAKRAALCKFVHRFTGEHQPSWVEDGVPPHHDTDADWLAHTSFAVTLEGYLDERVKHCQSTPSSAAYTAFKRSSS